MAIVYITDQGTSLSKSGERILVSKGKHTIRWFHSKDIDQLILLGNIAMTNQCITYLLKNRIDTVFLTYYGKYKGRLLGEFGKNIQLRIDQFRFLESPPHRISLAKLFVAAKINNALFIMKKRSQRLDNELLSSLIIRNGAILQYSLKDLVSVNELLGYEGIAAKNYFSAFAFFIKNEDFSFNGRNKRPPRDEINALLSLAYTFLLSNFLSKAYIIGLDPYYGSLHSLEYGRQSLVLDIMEEFRPLVDDMIITMINKKELNKSHFRFNQTIDSEDEQEKFLPVSLSSDGMKKFVYRFSGLLNSSFYYHRLNANLSLDKIFLAQMRLLAAHFQLKDSYSGFLLADGLKNA